MSMLMDEDSLLSSERVGLFTSDFFDPPAIPPFLLNSDFLPNENDKIVELNSKKLKDAADNGCKKFVGIGGDLSFSTDLDFPIEKDENTVKAKQLEEAELLLSKKISDFCKAKLSEDEMKLFAKYFRAKRVNLGFTQVDVCDGLKVMFESNFSQTTICRFEALQLTYNNMSTLFPYLLKWLTEADSAIMPSSKNNSTAENLTKENLANPVDYSFEDNSKRKIEKRDDSFEPLSKIVVGKKRKKRASIDVNLRNTLETLYLNNPRPSTKDLNSISEKLKLDRGVVRVWFCNRRQREKKQSSHLNLLFV